MYLGVGGGAVLEQNPGPGWFWTPTHGQLVWRDLTLKDLVELGPELRADPRLRAGEGGGNRPDIHK